MPLTKHRLGGPVPAGRQFTDRVPFIEAAERVLREPVSEHPTVLAFYGVGGIGKTSLLKELRRRLTAERPKVAHAQLDFRDPGNWLPASALVRLRAALREGYGIAFPTFDIAFAIYWKLANPHLPLTKAELKFLGEGEFAADVFSTLDNFPIVGLVARLPRLIHQAGRAVQEWWTRRGRDELRHIAALDSPSAVAEWLPAFWAADLRAWLDDHPGRRAVVLLDTYEALWQGQSVGERGTPPDEWVRDWAAHLAGVLVVVASHSKLRWTEADDTWAPHLEQHLMGGLAPEDSERFLRSCGVAEPDVRAVIVQRSEGVPYFLDLAVKTYERMRATAGRAPRAEEFDENDQQLLDRLLHYLTPAERAALFTLSVPVAFDVARFQDLMRAFATGYPASAVGFEALTRFSLLEERGGGWYGLHPLLREALAKRHRATERTAVHRYLFDEARATLEGVTPRTIADRERRALADAVEHGRPVLAPADFAAWYWPAEEPFEQAAEYHLLLPLRSRVLEYVRHELGPDHPFALMSAEGLAAGLHARGDLAGSEALLRRVLESRERVLGKEHPHTLSSVHNLATVLHTRGALADAEALHRRALEARERALGPEDRETLRSLNNVALVLRDRGDLASAEALLRRALEVRERVLGFEDRDTLASLNDLAIALRERRDLASAEALLRREVEACERLFGADHPDTLNSLNNLATVLHDRGDPAAAEALFRRAFEVLERRLGAEHPHTLTPLHNLALVLHARGDLAGAEALHRRVLEARERLLGPEHPHTLTSLRGLAAVLRDRGDLAGAEALFRRALTGLEWVLGPDHPTTQTVRENLGALLGSG